MDDSYYTASELRSRYRQGGSIPDSELSSSQLRARYGINNNSAGRYAWSMCVQCMCIYGCTYMPIVCVYYGLMGVRSLHGSGCMP